MDARHRDALTESAIDGEIQGLLSVDPSPEFLARVRESVADAPIASPFSWWLPAFGAAAAVAVLVVVFTISASRTAVPELARVPAPPASTPVITAPIELSLAAVAVTAASPVTAGVRRTRTRTVVAAVSRPSDFPEVIMDPDVVRSLREVVASVNAGRFEISPEGLQALSDASIPEVTITPVSLFVSDEGALQ